jgi:hypothetical protein
MIVVAHVAGMPVEEILTAAPGAGAGLMLAGGWILLHVRRRPKPGHDRRHDAAN